MKKNVAVEVRNVRKQFSYARHNSDSIKSSITQVFKKKDRGKNTFFALDGVSFDIKKGDFFGILGRNGSGKSTLLKIISEIYQPTSGSVQHDGKLVSFIELGVGFKTELTGRENVYLNGALLGFSKSEIDAMYDDIVSFAELEKFMDQRLKNYSSGMKVRLAFSVAIRSKSDILILDEVLAVGDASFKKKSNDYFVSLKETDQTVVLVTHSMSNVRRFCNKAIVIDEGKIVFEGGADEAASKYLSLFNGDTNDDYVSDNSANKGIYIKNSSIKQTDDNTELAVELHARESVDSLKIVVEIKDFKGRTVAGFNSLQNGDAAIKIDSSGQHKVTFEFDNIFKEATYTFNISLKSVDDTHVYDVVQHSKILSGPVDAPPYRVSVPINIK